MSVKKRISIGDGSKARLQSYDGSDHTVNKRLHADGRVYDRHTREWIYPEIPLSVAEERIRESVFKSIDRVNRKLSDMIPVAYDAESKMWVVNDYRSKSSGRNGKSGDIPIEIKITRTHGKFHVESFQWRGDEKSGRQLQLQLNSNDVLTAEMVHELNEEARLFDDANVNASDMDSVRGLVKSEARIMGLKPIKVKFGHVKIRVVKSRNPTVVYGALGSYNSKNNTMTLDPNLLSEYELSKWFSGQRDSIDPNKDLEKIVRHELLHARTHMIKAREYKRSLGLKSLGYKKRLIRNERLVRDTAEASYESGSDEKPT